ncbi:TonB-dependent receptor [Aquimarina sp. D1M17]|uniref:TonB-dependent receptor plug domain-containing protein n=1 Tax=Aquimarina acroporae TaxID=2937283 RepID=UPI0020BED514|nr:TonB-dependent receptor [Aquimarina acroporae]MCK8523526.1 TonB-dependent receptor [Aquimarina acroporae]
MNKKVFLGAAFLVLGTSLTFGQEEQNEETVNELEEVVISDSKFGLKREQSGKVITKITQKELERSQGQSVATVLNRVAGIEINGNTSAPGQSLGYFIRGGRNRQVVIRVDGITVSDPSTITGEFDLRLLSVNQIKQIEILKGASSTLYGSGASTAVVNITTKSESKEAISANFQSSIGTNQSQEDQDYDVNEFVNLASVNGTLGKVSYLASFSNQFSDGLSAAERLPEDTSVVPFEDDAYSKFNVNAKVGYELNDRINIQLFGNLDQYKNEFDAGAGADAINDAFSRQLRAGASIEFEYTNGSVFFTNSYSLLDREFLSNTFASKNESRFYSYDVYNKYNFNDTFYTVLGVNGSNNDYDGFSAPSRNDELVRTIDDVVADFDIIDPYANVVYVSDFGLNVNLGARLNIHSAYGTHLVYSVNPSYTYKLDDTRSVKALASYSTAYITPSLFQLFSPNFGNSDLEPEENTTVEAGLEYLGGRKFRASVVYFTRFEENFVDFVDTGGFVFQYQNIGDDFTTSGVEFEVNSRLLEDKLSLTGNFTYTDVDEELSQIRIPEIKVNASVGYQINEKVFSSLSYQFNDDREDSFFNTTTFASEARTLDSYGILDFYLSYKLMQNFMVYGALNNVTNEDYQEIFGFSTRGRNLRLGFNLNF